MTNDDKKLLADVDVLLSTREQSIKSVSEMRARLEKAQSSIDVAKCSQVVFKAISKIKHQDTLLRIEDMVSEFLRDVYDNTYSFKFDFTSRGSSSSCDLTVRSGGLKSYAPIKMRRGRSVSRFVGMLLRAMFVASGNGPKFMLLDEPLDGLEPSKQILAAEMMLKLSSELKMQILAVTHMGALVEVADAKFKITKKVLKK